jgi:hypothetical protein
LLPRKKRMTYATASGFAGHAKTREGTKPLGAAGLVVAGGVLGVVGGVVVRAGAVVVAAVVAGGCVEVVVGAVCVATGVVTAERFVVGAGSARERLRTTAAAIANASTTAAATA